ncbi:dihydroorotase [Planctomycetota bacterium]|nr:dihydroorotase [Planctomycetota bacterium]
MDAILIKAGRVIDPASKHTAIADVLIVGETIAAIGSISEDAARSKHGVTGDITTIDASSLVVAPGLIDLRCHVGEPGEDFEDTIAHAAKVAVSGGFTTICVMPDTDPANDTVASATFVRRQSEQAGFADVHPICALTKDRAGEELAEIGQLIEAGAVAFSDEQRDSDTPAAILRAFKYAAMFDVPVMESSVDTSIASGVMNAGFESTLAGMPGIPAVAEELAIARACMFARDAGCHYHAPMLSVRNSVRAVKRAKRLGVRVTADINAHQFARTDADVRESIDTNLKVSPPFRTQDDINWLKRGLREGVINCIASGHRSVQPQHKELEFGRAPEGAVGLETALGVALTHLHHTSDLSLMQVIAAFTSNPADVLRMKDRGEIAVGQRGDLCLIDPNHEWQVTPESLTSHTKNSPLLGQTLKGRARKTVTRGQVFDVN